MSVLLWVCIGFFILTVIFFGRKPLLWILKLFSNGCVGLAVIFTANAFLHGSDVGINSFTATVSAVFGLPGAVLVCLLTRII